MAAPSRDAVVTVFGWLTGWVDGWMDKLAAVQILRMIFRGADVARLGPITTTIFNEVTGGGWCGLPSQKNGTRLERSGKQSESEDPNDCYRQ